MQVTYRPTVNTCAPVVLSETDVFTFCLSVSVRAKKEKNYTYNGIEIDLAFVHSSLLYPC